MIYHINIAGITIALHSSERIHINKKLSTFISKASLPADLQLHIMKNLPILLPADALMLDEKLYWSQIDEEKDETEIYLYDPDTSRYTHALKVNRYWDKGVIICNDENEDLLMPFFGSLGEILFRNHLLYRQGLAVHASAISWQGKGIMFSAPSGTGKTTQANLWKRYKKAKLLNADRPAVRVIEEKTYVYGTLWNGSSQKYKNQELPLRAIVLIEQSKENTIRKLDKREAVTKLMPRCFLPYYHKEIMDLAINNLEKIIAVTPVFYLQCRPDREAVEILYQCLI